MTSTWGVSEKEKEWFGVKPWVFVVCLIPRVWEVLLEEMYLFQSSERDEVWEAQGRKWLLVCSLREYFFSAYCLSGHGCVMKRRKQVATCAWGISLGLLWLWGRRELKPDEFLIHGRKPSVPMHWVLPLLQLCFGTTANYLHLCLLWLLYPQALPLAPCDSWPHEDGIPEVDLRNHMLSARKC